MTMPFPRPPAHAVSLDAVWAATFAAEFVRAFAAGLTNGEASESAMARADAAVAALERWRARERGDGA